MFVTSGCRDCKICTRLGIVSLLLSPFTLIWVVCFSWNIGLLVRKCPQCGHATRHHYGRLDGTFRDNPPAPPPAPNDGSSTNSLWVLILILLLVALTLLRAILG